MKENVIQVKSYAFSLKIIQAFKFLQYEKKEYVLSKQILRSGTSIGANVEEAIGGQSRKDFFAKLTISYKEARETKYWVRLLRDSHYLPIELSRDLLKDVDEILRIIGSIQKTMRSS
ncbi:four helix bundle protein [Brumimicrobium oceani]|uniref:Four helix bundle protein n=1 Tax=Brumimicrobium oceani TaxID=2100725 RepID=A0A2U2XBV5_9FLAO|nr:four helix bundle protein [Brumimicrobium oceani]PWH85243.1 four helix bundle protein [Brumimicrobium oceani]